MKGVNELFALKPGDSAHKLVQLRPREECDMCRPLDGMEAMPQGDQLGETALDQFVDTMRITAAALFLFVRSFDRSSSSTTKRDATSVSFAAAISKSFTSRAAPSVLIFSVTCSPVPTVLASSSSLSGGMSSLAAHASDSVSSSGVGVSHGASASISPMVMIPSGTSSSSILDRLRAITGSNG
eukprot:CAMPEP_0174704606 /NCGR_PEP_ID=MMETSP1094-20130205/8134_1 /TAXON_ID=156173 /ORGANISM="Chrysochromulina brevifilum, Strain UTEX LB 985" /LENGTH=182 /DNA_ID=CAMNT_0015902681 /DNA_START=314 /DNA_END=863 /DNA_ORIENTATION=-